MPIRRKIKNSVGRYSQAELLVREATSNDPALPSQELLMQIADMSNLPSFYTDTINMVFKRLNDKCKNWRHIHKALIVIEACLQYGSIQFIKECQFQLPQILTLCDFVYSYDRNSNAGFLIREKAQRVAALLKDENLLKQERQTARSDYSRRHSTYARSKQYLDASERDYHVETTYRSRSVYNPSDEYDNHNDAKEREQSRLSMAINLQESPGNPSQKSDSISKPTLLESSRKAANTRANDLLFFDDPPPKTGRFHTWLESRSKRFSSMSSSDIYTPSSSLITDSGSNLNEKWSTGGNGMKSNILDDVNILDFDPLSTSQEEKKNLFDVFSVQTTTKASTLIPPLPPTVSIHKTSADEYFESHAMEKKASTIILAESVPTVKALLEPEKDEVGTNLESSTITKTCSKITSILGAHKDLVDLENIVTVQKPPLINPISLFGDSNLAQNDVYSKPSLTELGENTDWFSLTQPVMTNQCVPMSYETPWQSLIDQSQLGTLYTPNPATNRVPSKNTNPFL